LVAATVLLASLFLAEATETSFGAAPSWPWPSWRKHGPPVEERRSEGDNIASDPSVILDPTAGRYRMAFTGPSREHDRSSIIGATSPDGVHWTDVPFNDGVILEGGPDDWDGYVETSDLLQRGGQYLLFYSGYQESPVFAEIQEAEVGLATSPDGVHFTRAPEPVMRRTRGGWDNDAIFSPSVIDVGGTLYMVYTGWCLDQCAAIGGPSGAQILGATSTDGGLTWTKRPGGPIFEPSDDYPWMDNSTDEADLMIGPDGAYYVFFTASSLTLGQPPVSIGMARSFASPFGPWEIYPRPVITPSGLWERVDMGFPTVVDDGGAGRMWYTGVGLRGISAQALGFRIGLATAAA
jgi:hypothetical protein